MLLIIFFRLLIIFTKIGIVFDRIGRRFFATTFRAKNLFISHPFLGFKNEEVGGRCAYLGKKNEKIFTPLHPQYLQGE